jgi:hypothetical protein
MKKYPVGIQDFEKLRKGGYFYIDKTQAMYGLVETGNHYFLSRPRRFGKSLLVSTLKYFFQGKKELFEGLWVAREADHEWQAYPVVHFSFSSIGYKDIGLEAALIREVDRSAKELGIELGEKGLSARFKELIRILGSRPNKLVLLIDEYDKPLIDYIDDQEQAEANRAILKNFFSVLKDSDAYLRFFLITGVSKFSKVSVFSDLNHLLDITLVERFATLTGITQAELDTHFEGEILELARKFDTSFQAMRQRIKSWYNGYSFGAEKVYNPFSLLSFFSTQRFANFWWESGTPYFLMKLLRKDNQYDLRHMRAGSATFESYTLDNLDWLPLLFQTGYLTILDYDDRLRLYTLGYPNLEVKEAFLQHLLAVYRETGPSQSYALFIQLKEAIDAGDIPELVKVVNTLFATVPYQLFESRKESFFHAILHLSFSGMGLVTQSEVSTAQGRVDTVVHTDDRIYVIEFKLDDTALAALDQIREKRYGSPFLDQGKEVIALGISFSSQTKTVAEWEETPYLTLLTSG